MTENYLNYVIPAKNFRFDTITKKFYSPAFSDLEGKIPFAPSKGERKLCAYSPENYDCSTKKHPCSECTYHPFNSRHVHR